VRSFSLTNRLIAAVVACQLLLTAGLVTVAILYARSELRGTFDAALEGRAMSALALVRYDEDEPHVLRFDADRLPPSQDPPNHDLYEIRGADGQLIAASNGWESLSRLAPQSSGRYADFQFSGSPYRAIVFGNVPVLDQEGDEVAPKKVTVIYAVSLAEMRHRLTTLAVYVGLSSLLLLLAANSFAAWSVRRGLEPLRELAEQANTISVRNWDFRPPRGATLATELSPLTRAIQAVLARLQESFRQQRDFTSNAAHELKTSVAIIKSTVQSLLQRPRTEQEYFAGLERLLEDCDRLEDLLARMLRLARIEQMSEKMLPSTRATTELTSTCEAAVSCIRALADARQVTMEFSGPPAVHLHADPEDLELVWLNLLENAVRYSPSGSKVNIHVERNGGNFAEVSVSDSGPGIPPAELPHIFERFHRGDPSRARSTGGFGLGLAICKTLVEAYGGTIEVMNLPLQGTQVRVELPVDPS
jgi:signal transduction histidine kinase